MTKNSFTLIRYKSVFLSLIIVYIKWITINRIIINLSTNESMQIFIISSIRYEIRFWGKFSSFRIKDNDNSRQTWHNGNIFIVYLIYLSFFVRTFNQLQDIYIFARISFVSNFDLCFVISYRKETNDRSNSMPNEWRNRDEEGVARLPLNRDSSAIFSIRSWERSFPQLIIRLKISNWKSCHKQRW